MERNCENSEVKNDLFVRIKVKKMPRYKAPAELADKVQMIAVEVDETETEKESTLDLNIHIQSRAGIKLAKADLC
jgi:hypothetical protein